ncbi:MAG TPA: hypothetical protein VFP84_27795 [Kofleriaceae bacterium]|nr:hypothetical protein [Kofleriaceae bacterium]
MATFQKSCDVKQGFDFKKDIQTPVGFLTSLSIGGIALKADITVKDPMNPATDLPVVAVLSGVMWELGPTDTLYYTGQISTANKQATHNLLYSSLSKVDVVIAFSVYSYDPIEKAYFKCMLPTSDPLNGIVEKNGTDLNLSVADDVSGEVQSPENYAFQIGVKPQPSAQQVTVATSFSVNIVKPWGIALAA